jgi:hypothetical protein
VARKPLDGTVTLLQRISNSVRRWLETGEILLAGQLAIESRVSRIDKIIRDIEAKDVTRHEDTVSGINQLLAGQISLDKRAIERHEDIVVLFKATDLAQSQRHEELLGAINRLSTILTNAHLTEPPMFHAPVLDWEQVQADALAQLEREMEK